MTTNKGGEGDIYEMIQRRVRSAHPHWKEWDATEYYCLMEKYRHEGSRDDIVQVIPFDDILAQTIQSELHERGIEKDRFYFVHNTRDT